MTDRGMSRRTWLILRWAMIGALSGALASLLLFLVGPALSYLPVRQFLRLYIDFGPFKFWLDPGQFMSGLAFGLVTGSAFLHANLLSRKQLAVYVLGCILSFFAGGVIGLIPNMSGLVESRYLAAPLGGLAKAGLLMMVSGTLMPAFRRPRTIVLTIIVGGGLAAILIVPNLFFPDPFFFLKNREIGSLLRLAISTVWHAGIAAAMATVFDGRKWPDRDTGSAVDPDGFGFDFSQRARVIVRWTLIGLLSGVITAALIPLTKWSLFLLWVRDLPDIIGIAMLFLLVVPVWPGPVFGVVMGRALIRSGFLRPERYAGYVTIATLSYIAAGAATASLAIATGAFKQYSNALPWVGFSGGLVGAGLLTALSAWIMPDIWRLRPAIIAVLACALAGGMFIQFETVSYFITIKGYLLLIIWPAAYAGAMGATFPLMETRAEPAPAPPG